MQTRRFHSLQTRLTLAFSLLFLASILILVIFIKFAADASQYDALARNAFAEARQLYRARLDLQHFQTALSQYTVTSDPSWLDEYHSSASRLQQYLVNAAEQQPGDKAAFDQVNAELTALREIADQSIAAVDQEDWDAVDELEAEAAIKIKAIVAQIDALVAARTLQLAAARQEVNAFSSLGLAAMWVAVPFFLVLLGVAVWIINRQVNKPLKRLTDGLPQILTGSFDPARLSGLPERQDEIGFLAREYLQMAAAVQDRQAELQQQAGELRARIHP